MPAGRQGFTLLEILIVVAIIILLSTVILINLRGQTARANDAKRKMDLNTMNKVTEDYYNDHSGYPFSASFGTCGSAFEPYIARIPCDPVSKMPYGYFPAVNGGYRICAKLSDTTDPAIAAMNCSGYQGCGVGCGYNFCLASGVPASAVNTADEVPCIATPTPTGVPTASPTIGPAPTATPTPPASYTPTPTITFAPVPHYACTPSGDCNYYADPYGAGCPVAWTDKTCGGYIPGQPYTGYCADKANLCTDRGGTAF